MTKDEDSYMLIKYLIRVISLSFLFLFISQYSYGLDLTRVYAYPVPFIPSKHTYITIQIKYSGASFARCTVYDINGDKVKELAGSNDIIWNGRNDMGNLVSPGMYIVKIELEAENGEYKKKIIRILVQ